MGWKEWEKTEQRYGAVKKIHSIICDLRLQRYLTQISYMLTFIPTKKTLIGWINQTLFHFKYFI